MDQLDNLFLESMKEMAHFEENKKLNEIFTRACKEYMIWTNRIAVIDLDIDFYHKEADVACSAGLYSLMDDYLRKVNDFIVKRKWLLDQRYEAAKIIDQAIKIGMSH